MSAGTKSTITDSSNPANISRHRCCCVSPNCRESKRNRAAAPGRRIRNKLKFMTGAGHNDFPARLASLHDAAAIAAIYNQGIEDRVATFETQPRTPDDVAAWFDGVHPTVVVESSGQVVAFASTSTYRPRACYAGIAEVSLYVERSFRRRGAGRAAMSLL